MHRGANGKSTRAKTLSPTLATHNVPVEQTTKNIYSRDRNIWHLSHEGGVLEDPANAPEESMWQWVVSPAKAPDQPTTVEIGFDAGVPVFVNGKKLGAVALIEQLNEIAAANGVGRMEMVENRLVGIKSRGAYETPGGTLLIAAHRELESLCLDRETAHYQQMLALTLRGNGLLRNVVHAPARIARRVLREIAGARHW